MLNKREMPVSKTLYAYEYIKEGIRAGKWTFGEEISVVGAANELSFSRRPVIDALKRLEAESFVEILPQSGCRVKDYPKKDIYDHFMTVMVLEGISAYLATRRRDESKIKELYQVNDELRKIVETEPFSKEKYFAVNRQFHGLILDMTRSEKLKEMIKGEWDLNDFLLTNISLKPGNLERTIIEHELIIGKIAGNDHHGARALMENHMNNFAMLIKNEND